MAVTFTVVVRFRGVSRNCYGVAIGADTTRALLVLGQDGGDSGGGEVWQMARNATSFELLIYAE